METNTTLSYLAIIAILLGIYIYRWKSSRKRLFKLAAQIPPPLNIPSYPLIGHAFHFMGEAEKMLYKMLYVSEQPGPLALWFGPKLTIVINRPEDLAVILNSRHALNKNGFYSFFDEIVGHGLLNAPEATWRRHKKIMLPTFNQKFLDGFVSNFAKLANNFVLQLSSQNGKIVDMYNYTAPYSVKGITETLLGVDLEPATVTSLYKTIDRMQELTMHRYAFLPYYSNFIFKHSKMGSEMYEHMKYFHSVLDSIIKQSKDNMNSNEYNVETVPGTVMLEELLSHVGKEITIKEVFDEVATAIIGGSDTTATTTCFVLIMLGMHKEVEQKVYEEVIEVLGPDRDIEYHDMPKFVYLQQVIYETFRMFSVVPNAFRKVKADIVLENYILPRGANLLLAFQAMHRSPRYFEDPLKFNPDRFHPDKMQDLHKHVFQPFSSGPRNCIGLKYAMFSLKTILSTTIRKFMFETTYQSIEEIDTCQDIFLRATKGYPLKIIPRN